MFNNFFNNLNKFFSKDDSLEFKSLVTELEEREINPVGISIFWLSISVLLITLIVMIIMKVDIVISARGVIVPEGNIKFLQPLDTGVVKNILIKEGDYVKKNQLLVEIDSSTTSEELISMQQNLGQLELEINRLLATSSGSSYDGGSNQSALIQKSINQAALNSLNEQQSAKYNQLNGINELSKAVQVQKNNSIELLKLARDKEKRLKSIIDLIPKDDYEKNQNDIVTYQNQIKQYDYKLSELSQQKNQVSQEASSIKSNFTVNTLSELSQKEKEYNILKSRIVEILYKKSKQKLVSPVDGYIETLYINTIGGIVTQAQNIIAIVPSDSALSIKASILNKDIGYVKENLPVTIKIDTFDYQKYGTLKGKVKLISRTSINNEKLGPIYEVNITPLDKFIMVDGKQEKISSGMSVTAEIKVGKRRIIEFFINPIVKYLNDGLSVK